MTTIATANTRTKVEEVTALIVPAQGVSIEQALRDAQPECEKVEVRKKVNKALLTLFKRKPSRPAIEFVDGVLFFRCAVPKDAPTIALNIEEGVVFGAVRCLAVWDTVTDKEWARSYFNDKPLDLSMGGVMTITQRKE